MRESPATYGIASREAVDGFVRDACRKCVQTLAQYHIISYCPETGAIAPRSLSQVISRNAVEISTVIGIMQVNNELQSEKDYMLALCKSGELGRYRSKLD